MALSTALSATLTAQLVFDSKQLKYCSTYNLAEALDKNMKKGIYHLGADAYELAVTPKKKRFWAIWSPCCNVFSLIQEYMELFVNHNWFQRFILFCILTNTFSMGIEFHSQPEILTKTVELSNLVFSIIFAIEMLLKLTAYGFFQYISDGFNVFDGLIVILRYTKSLIFLPSLYTKAALSKRDEAELWGKKYYVELD